MQLLAGRYLGEGHPIPTARTYQFQIPLEKIGADTAAAGRLVQAMPHEFGEEFQPGQPTSKITASVELKAAW